MTFLLDQHNVIISSRGCAVMVEEVQKFHRTAILPEEELRFRGALPGASCDFHHRRNCEFTSKTNKANAEERFS